MSTFLAMLDHAVWADARAHDTIRGLPADSPERAQATRLYAHLAAAEHVWLARLEGRTPAHPVWPALALDAAAALAAESRAGLRAVAADGPERLGHEIVYRTTAGDEFRSTVADVLAQVVLHGSYHRGQIALLARAGGGTPAVTDYIVFTRGVAAPASAPAAPPPAAGARAG
jgi:uncharacterized damage-inducible protein DinB